MVDTAVESRASWVCHAQGRHLADVLLPVHIGQKDHHEEEELGQPEEDVTNWGDPVLLEQTEEGSPCILTLLCSPSSPAAIGRLLVISEARTMEVYDQMGEYCGTVRGERDNRIQPDSSDRGPFYRKQLILEQPSSACEVKLLSLAGRSSVLVCRVIVGLQQLRPGPARGPGIDMQQVQSLVEEMGTSLSPGAQNLMDMVHFQQKNQTGSLGGFLPLLMGSGALSALAQGAAVSIQPQPAAPGPPAGSIVPADEAPPPQNGAMSNGSTSPSPDGPLSGVDTKSLIREVSSGIGGQVSHAQLAEMMSHFLKGRGHERAPGSGPGPELLPMLQSVCGQVTKLRLDDAAALAESEEKMRNGTWELDSAMERRLEEMERRLKEHVDRRLDALEQKLERALLSALPQLALSQVAASGSTGGEAAAVAGSATTGAQEQSAPTAASH